MTTTQNILSALVLALLPLACEAAHVELPLHGHEEEFVEHDEVRHGGIGSPPDP